MVVKGYIMKTLVQVSYVICFGLFCFMFILAGFEAMELLQYGLSN